MSPRRLGNMTQRVGHERIMRLIKTILVLAVGCELTGCATLERRTDAALSQDILFGCSQTLLRDAIAFIDDQTPIHVRLESRLSEVADLSITYLPRREQDQHLPVSVALDILKWSVIEVYHVPVDWKSDNEGVLFFFAGSDDEYKTMRLRD